MVTGVLGDGSVNDATQLVGNASNVGLNTDLAARTEVIDDGMKNALFAENTLNKVNDQLTEGTSLDTNVHVVRSINNGTAQATANISNKQDVYVAQGKTADAVGLLVHENAHVSGFKETGANTLGALGSAAYEVGKFMNNEDVGATQAAYAAQFNTSQNDPVQQTLLDLNAMKLEMQQTIDVFEDKKYSTSVEGTLVLGGGLNLSLGAAYDTETKGLTWAMTTGPRVGFDLGIAGKYQTSDSDKVLDTGLKVPLGVNVSGSALLWGTKYNVVGTPDITSEYSQLYLPNAHQLQGNIQKGLKPEVPEAIRPRLGLGGSIGVETGTEYTVNLQPVFNATKFVGNTLQNMGSTALTIMTTPACKTAGCVGIQPLPYILPNQKPLDNTRYTILPADKGAKK